MGVKPINLLKTLIHPYQMMTSIKSLVIGLSNQNKRTNTYVLMTVGMNNVTLLTVEIGKPKLFQRYFLND